jgi:hypothetical protein
MESRFSWLANGTAAIVDQAIMSCGAGMTTDKPYLVGSQEK